MFSEEPLDVVDERDRGLFDGRSQSLWVVEIEILETLLIESVNDQGEHTLDVEVVTRMKTNDPEAIRQLVDLLDKEFEFVSLKGVRTMFEIHFRLDDGRAQVLSFDREGENPLVLRGEQSIWEGRDILPGTEFGTLIEDLLASSQ